MTNGGVIGLVVSVMKAVGETAMKDVAAMEEVQRR
jgi:hypothetical protein